MSQLTIFFDGRCALCAKEMESLKELDRHNRITFENIFAHDFAKNYASVNVEDANRVLQGMKDTGELIYGLDVTVLAWTLVGKGKWVAPLRWPIIKQIADVAYIFFARNREQISRFIMRSRPVTRCDFKSDS
ncbi:MAG: thiol-disulfide oxidoreductase DCC [Porticoccaceae bacterium]|nr:thiol-disulfide oxidoreductase DCC [Porticoccaceae bacterium]|tara:strand:- start:921 stop:1316 length:396 start_codon:yes stop_codon:yes gene_type:complete